MMRTVACLHTIDSNVAAFDALCPPGLVLQHRVEPGLLAEAEREGGLTDGLAARTAGVLAGLREGAAAVLLTCSTLGPAVARLAGGDVPVLRADAALAEVVRGRAGRRVVLCAAPTTLGPTRALFGEGVEVALVDGAWGLFRAGRRDAYYDAVARAADAAFRSGAETVALAQVSMTGAAARCAHGEPLTVPRASLARIEGMLA